jgi:tetratricopeptide (TPR) repeat protein
MSIEQIIFYYIKFVKFFLQKNRNIKIIFINFPLFHHHSFLVRDRVKELNYAFIKNIFLQNNSFFIPALKLPKEHINEKDINHFKNFNGRSVYKYYAKIIKFIMDDYFDNQTWQKLSQIEEKTLLDKLDEIIIKSTTYQGKKMQIEKTNVQINSQKLAKEYLKQLNELASHDKHDEVIAKSKQLLELDFNNSDIYNDIEKILLKNNKNNQLIEIYKQAIQCRPTNSWLYKRLGDSYYKEDKLDNAIDCYERAIEINKNFFWSYKKLGDSYQVKGRQYFKKAYDSYQKAIEIKSNFEDNLTKKLEKISQVIDQSHSSNHLPKDRNNYWNKRKDGLLYQMIKSLASGYVPNGSSVLEVGCHTSSFIFELDWFKEKVVTDLPFLSEHWQGIEGVKFIPGDFYKLKFDRTFDLVLCTQVVEHLQEPKLFIQKLLSLGKTVIVSTTYEVPEGLCKYHVQDPISLEKFQEWFDREFTATVIIEKPNQKIWKNIIGVVKQE